MALCGGNRHSVTRTSAVSTCTVGIAAVVTPARASDHAVALERGQIALAVAQELAVDLGVVLAEEWSTRDLGRRRRHADRVAGDRHASPPRMVALADHAALAQLLVGHALIRG